MKFQRTVLVDCHGIGHWLKHSMQFMSSGNTSTGIIYGFLGFIKECVEKMNPGQFVFAWDSQQSHRKRLYPLYKHNRNPEEKTDEEIEENKNMMKQLMLLRDEILPSLGFLNSFMSIGREADDIIASCVLFTPGKKFIASRDADLHQMLSPQTCMWDFQKKVFFTDGDFRDKWKIDPVVWRKVKCIAGCTGDCVPNVPGVKELTAIKYLEGTLAPQYKTYKAIKENQQLIEDNAPLVCLPFDGTPRYAVKRDQVKIAAFWELCEKYEFNSYLDNIDEWVDTLKMT
jgi:5'-3' exonuclease